MRVKGLVSGNPDALSSLHPVCYRLSVRCSGGTCILTLLTSTASAGPGVSLSGSGRWGLPLWVWGLLSGSRCWGPSLGPGSGVSSSGPGARVPLRVWGLGSPSPGAGVSLSGSGLWGLPLRVRALRSPSLGPGAGVPLGCCFVLTASALHRGSPRGGCGRGTGQTLTALEMLPNQHAFSPPFENKNGAIMDRWEEGRSQLRQAGRRVAGEGFPEGTGRGAGPGGI